MRDLFPGYFSPTEAQLKNAWETGHFVLDTNVLLNLYRYEKSTRDELVEVLGKIADRLWMPYQVGLEFHRRRLEVISGEKLAFDKASTNVSEHIQKITGVFSDRSRNPHPSQALSKLLAELEALSAKIAHEIKESGSILPDVHQHDEVREQLVKLFGERVGVAPDQGWLDAIAAEGETRFKLGVPPGARDAAKEGQFSDKGSTYQEKFGDLIVWKQTVEHARDVKWSSLIFVTDDAKPDWWHIVAGKTIGPRAELREEIRRLAGIEVFHMYSSSRMLEHAKTYLNAKVSEESIEQVRELATQTDVTSRGLTPLEVAQVNKGEITAAVAHWFRWKYGDNRLTLNSPPFDFIFRNGDGSDTKVIIRLLGGRAMPTEETFDRVRKLVADSGAEGGIYAVFVGFSEGDARFAFAEFYRNAMYVAVFKAIPLFGFVSMRGRRMIFTPIDNGVLG